MNKVNCEAGEQDFNDFSIVLERKTSWQAVAIREARIECSVPHQLSQNKDPLERMLPPF